MIIYVILYKVVEYIKKFILYTIEITVLTIEILWTHIYLTYVVYPLKFGSSIFLKLLFCKSKFEKFEFRRFPLK